MPFVCDKIFPKSINCRSSDMKKAAEVTCGLKQDLQANLESFINIRLNISKKYPQKYFEVQNTLDKFLIIVYNIYSLIFKQYENQIIKQSFC